MTEIEPILRAIGAIAVIAVIAVIAMIAGTILVRLHAPACGNVA